MNIEQQTEETKEKGAYRDYCYPLSCVSVYHYTSATMKWYVQPFVLLYLFDF